MGARLLILLLVLGFGALTLVAFIQLGVTLPGVVSLFVFVLLTFAAIGVMRTPPGR